MNIYTGIVTVLAVILVSIGLLLNLAGKATGKYRRKDLMSANEKEFFGRLLSALPGHFVFPQVAMSAILEASATNANVKHQDRLRIAQQRIDYLICNSACHTVAVIELDDRTHNKKKDDIRDSRLAQAEIPTIRFESRQKPSIQDIAAAIAEVEKRTALVSPV